MKEIVAAMVGTFITNDPTHIASAIETNTLTEFLDRDRMKFMAALDLGEHWKKLASSRTLFCIDDAGNPQAADFGQKPT